MTNVILKRVYNNNVVLAIELDGTEVVLLGKGIGFQRRPGETIDASGSQRFIPAEPYGVTHVADLLSDASLEEASAAHSIAALGRDQLKMRVGEALLLPILDHLRFAVKRAREGTTVDFPLRWEVAHIFPEEAAVGRQAVRLANEQLGIRLQDDEWVAFALHFVNHRWAGGDLTRTMTMTETIKGSFELLQTEWDTKIDQDSLSSARFVTHIRYLFVRALEGRLLDEGRIDVIMTPLWMSFPAATAAAEKLRALIGRAAKRVLTKEEGAYLTLHTIRLYMEVISKND